MRHHSPFQLLGVALGLLLACSDDAATSNGAGSDQGGGGQGSGNGAAPSTGGSPAGTGGDGAATATSTGGAAPGICDNGPLAAPIQGCAPGLLPSSGDAHQDCVDRINQLRAECQCLPPLARWTDAEACSDGQSQSDQATNTPHGNFGDCGESAQNTCPNWGSESDIVNGCLQSMWDEGPGEPFSEHGHYINMSNQGYSKVACGFSASAGGVWSNQNFSQ